MLWRGSARLGGVGGVDFNVFGNPAELVRELKMNAAQRDIPAGPVAWCAGGLLLSALL